MDKNDLTDLNMFFYLHWEQNRLGKNTLLSNHHFHRNGHMGFSVHTENKKGLLQKEKKTKLNRVR